jgi:hypothetical protein
MLLYGTPLRGGGHRNDDSAEFPTAAAMLCTGVTVAFFFAKLLFVLLMRCKL